MTKSVLLMYLNRKMATIHCKIDGTEFVKLKWKIPVNKIYKIEDEYEKKPKEFQLSNFYKKPFIDIFYKSINVYQ